MYSIELSKRNGDKFKNFSLETLIEMSEEGMFIECESGQPVRIIIEW